MMDWKEEEENSRSGQWRSRKDTIPMSYGGRAPLFTGA